MASVSEGRPRAASRDSDGLRAGRSGVRFPVEASDLSLLRSVHIQSEAYPASYKMGTGCSFPGIKWPGRITDHSPPSSAEAKNAVAIPPLPTRLYNVVLN
jgi:hypothetical protein